jgi:hypothetical protein
VKLLVKIVLPMAVLFAAAAAIAMAAPISPTTPYPNVPANADVCRVEKLEIQRQQLEYDAAAREYERTRLLYERRAASASELRAAERAAHLAGIRLNAAKYAEAACRNNLGNDANKACITLALELNRLIDELPMRRELERLATADYDAAVRAGAAVSPAERERLQLAAQVATIERQQTEQRITDQRARIRATPACRDYPSERPAPAPTSTSMPTSTSTPTSTTAPISTTATTIPTTTVTS